MPKALVVEDSEKWQKLHRIRLERVLGEGNVDVVDNYDDAISMLSRDYAVYVIDGQFIEHHDGDPRLLGVELAKAIGQKEGGYDKIAVVSTGSDTLSEARELGVTKTYRKYFFDDDLIRDLRPLLITEFGCYFDNALVKIHQSGTLTHLLLVVLYDNDIPQYCAPMPLDPEPDINIPVRDFPNIYTKALMLNRAVEDGAVMIKLPESVEEAPILTGWSYRLFAPPLNISRKTNRGSAYNSSLDFSGVEDVRFVYLVNKVDVIRFENGIENIFYQKDGNGS